MIMTNEKARELNRAATAALPTHGSYEVTTSFDVGEIASHNPDFVVMGMVVPADKVASFSRCIQNDSGFLPSPMILLKRAENEELNADDRSPIRPNWTDTDEENISINEIEITPGRHEAKVDGKLITLTFSEFRILQTLAEKPGWVFSREKLIHAIHGDDYSCTERAIDVQVTGLRKKLGKAGGYVETVRGVGYRFAE